MKNFLYKVIGLFYTKNNVLQKKEKILITIYSFYLLLLISNSIIFEKLIFFSHAAVYPFVIIANVINEPLSEIKREVYFKKKFKNLDNLIEENMILKSEINEYKTLIANIKKRELLEELIIRGKKIKIKGHLRLISSRSKDYIFVKIDSKNDTKINDLVVNQNLSLVGKITSYDLMLKIAKVELIEKSDSNVPIVVQGKNILGIINVDNKSICKMLLYPNDENEHIFDVVENGDVVITSHLDETIDYGIKIGIIQKVNNMVCVKREFDFTKQELFLVSNSYNIQEIESKL